MCFFAMSFMVDHDRAGGGETAGFSVGACRISSRRGLPSARKIFCSASVASPAALGLSKAPSLFHTIDIGMTLERRQIYRHGSPDSLVFCDRQHRNDLDRAITVRWPFGLRVHVRSADSGACPRNLRFYSS